MMNISIIDTLLPDDLNALVDLHLRPKEDPDTGRPLNRRFYGDKMRLFHGFDPRSIIVARDPGGRISGALVYTWDEPGFNCYAGPTHARFYGRALKTALGLYGTQFGKFLSAARSMTGRGGDAASSSGAPALTEFGKIWVMLVRGDCRRQGIGRALLMRCIDAMAERSAPTIRVTVLTDNTAAIRMYEQCAFVNVGTCMESSGESYIMERDVAPC